MNKSINNNNIQDDNSNKLVNNDNHINFYKYIHKIGSEKLQIQSSNENKQLLEQYKQQSNKIIKKFVKKIKVDDLEEQGIDAVISNDWDTSKWTDEMIESACDALILIFSKPNNINISRKSNLNDTDFKSFNNIDINEERKQKAIQMLEKLINRHQIAKVYMRKHIEVIVNQSCNRLIKNGKSCALLDMLYIVHCCRIDFSIELSKFNFIGISLEMLLLELRLAAIIVQHSFRIYHLKKQEKSIESNSYHSIVYTFGTNEEFTNIQKNVIRSRTNELKQKWREMRVNYKQSIASSTNSTNTTAYTDSNSSERISFHHSTFRKMISSSDISRTSSKSELCGGMRAPVHIGHKATYFILHIIYELVKDSNSNPLSYAITNSETCIYSNGCILLCNYIACPEGPFGDISTSIVMYVSKLLDAYQYLLQNNCIKSCYQYFSYYIKQIHSITKKNTKNSIYQCINNLLVIITNLANIESENTNENINIISLVDNIIDKSTNTYISQPVNIKSLELFNSNHYIALLQSIIIFLNQCNYLLTMRVLLQSLLSLISSPFSHIYISYELNAMNSKGYIKLLNLIEEADDIIHSYVLAIFIQSCNYSYSRDMLRHCLLSNLSNLVIDTGRYDRKTYNRSVYICIGLLRQTNRPLVKATNVYNQMYLSAAVYSIQQYSDIIRFYIIIDLLQSIKSTSKYNYISNHVINYDMIEELLYLPTNKLVCQEISMLLYEINEQTNNNFIYNLTSYFCHSKDSNYYNNISWIDTSTICLIIECFASNIPSSLFIISTNILEFLINCCYKGRYYFLSSCIVDRDVQLILMSIVSSMNILNNICQCIIDQSNNMIDSNTNRLAHVIIDGISKSNLLDNTCFFMKSLSVSNNSLSNNPTLQSLHIDLGISIVSYYNTYVQMLLNIDEQTLSSNYIPKLYELGKSLTEVIDL